MPIYRPSAELSDLKIRDSPWCSVSPKRPMDEIPPTPIKVVRIRPWGEVADNLEQILDEVVSRGVRIDDQSRLRQSPALFSVWGVYPQENARQRPFAFLLGAVLDHTSRKGMGGKAVVDELIHSNPCAFKRAELPPKIDRDPMWRAGAVFTRQEVEQLISDERIPEDRRVFNALVFLTGMRTDEATALRWRVYDSQLKPPSRLVVSTSYSTRLKMEKAVKTRRPREVPIHPTLAKVLAGWKLSGWARMY